MHNYILGGITVSLAVVTIFSPSSPRCRRREREEEKKGKKNQHSSLTLITVIKLVEPENCSRNYIDMTSMLYCTYISKSTCDLDISNNRSYAK